MATNRPQFDVNAIVEAEARIAAPRLGGNQVLVRSFAAEIRGSLLKTLKEEGDLVLKEDKTTRLVSSSELSTGQGVTLIQDLINKSLGINQKDSQGELLGVTKLDQKDLKEKVIAYAIARNNKIRILLHDDNPRKKGQFLKEWTTLFRALGFDGEIEAVGYTQLKNTTDIETIVVVPKGMNTHHNFWDRSSFDKVYVTGISSPRLISNGLTPASLDF